MLRLLHIAFRALGVLAGGALCAAWTYAIWLPSGGIALTGTSFVVALALALVALIAAIAAARGHSVVVVLAFLASFFPVGAFLMTAEHWLRWIGIADIALLASGFGLWLTARLGGYGRPLGEEQSRA